MLTVGDFEGSLDACWDANGRAKMYEVQTSPDPMSATSWTTRQTISKSYVNLSGLTSGSKVWVRVRALGVAGQGPWSDPAVKTVP